ncbi:LPS translocon maturation chaperone LptM [Pseudothauera lacus]|uniref:LPS translocon maturation chaperone LptM n=1 Tax=Pseudothauera lacus TaxID=2136175 RepID=UPI0015E64D69|nr:lipoprotein [Pseudothauera lacus]
MRITHLLAALACALMLQACGIKGSLYLPEQAPAGTAGDHSKAAPTPDARP